MTKKEHAKRDKARKAKRGEGDAEGALTHEVGGVTYAEADYRWAGPDDVRYDDAQAARLADLRARLRAHLSGHRLEHSLSVAYTARRLAASHGVDPFLAEEAGILHDWDKKLSSEELWAKVDEYAIPIDHDVRNTPVLHGMTAAASLRGELGLPDEVAQAISRHTVGAPDMSDLDIVVYCADMLEPLRGPALDDLRALARGPLDELFASCAQGSLLYLVQRGKYVSASALAVWNAYAPHLPASRKV